MEGYAPIHEAIRGGNEIAFGLIYLQDKNILKFYTDNGLTPLHATVMFDQLNIAQAILKINPKLLKLYSNNGLTPFHLAMSLGKLEIAQAMVDVDPSIVDSTMDIQGIMFNNPTALHLAGTDILVHQPTATYDNKKSIEFLIKNNATIDKTTLITIEGRSSSATPLVAATMSRKYEIMEILLKAGAKISAVTKEAIPPLLQAVKNDDPKAVEILTKYGSSEDIYDQEGYLTALNLSILACKPKVFEFLIEKYPDVEIRFSFFGPMLWTRDQETIEFFYSKLKNPKHLKQFEDALPFVITIERDSENFGGILGFFINNPIISSIFKKANYCLETAILLDDSTLFDLLVSAGAKTELLSEPFVFSLLLSAISTGDKPYLEKLINTYKLDINAKHTNDTGVTVVHLAAMFGNFEILKFLIDSNILFNEKDNEGFTPLDYAVFAGHNECIKLLLVALGIALPLNEGAEPANVLEGEPSVEDDVEEEYTPPTKEEEAHASSIGQQIHKLYQLHKVKLYELSNIREETTQSWVTKSRNGKLDEELLDEFSKTKKVKEESWVIKSANGNPDEVYSESEKDSASGEIFKGCGHAGKVTYFAIPKSLSLEIQGKYGDELLDKFKTAIDMGVVGPQGKSGVKVFEGLYEVKVYSSQYGKYRLYTTDEYINENSSKLIIFKNLGNHRDVALAARESAGIKCHMVKSIVELGHLEPVQGGRVRNLEEVDDLLVQYESEVEEKVDGGVRCAGDIDVGDNG